MATVMRRIFFLAGVGLLSLLGGWMVGGQVSLPQGSRWPPRAIRGRGGIAAWAHPVEEAQFTVQPGQPNAEMLAGNWEADDPIAGKPVQIGILLVIATDPRAPSDRGKAPRGGLHKFVSFDIRVYQRASGKDSGGWFSATRNDGGASWDGYRLRIGANGVGPDVFFQGELGLDLAFDGQKRSWTGSYTRNSVTRPVCLTRPGASQKTVSNPFVGGWSERGRGDGLSCVHIAQGLDGVLVAWRDTRIGPLIGPKNGRATGTVQEIDGNALGVQLAGDTLTLQDGIFGGVIAGQMFPGKFTGKLYPDRTRIIGKWGQSYQTPRGPYWYLMGKLTSLKKMTGQSCWSQGPN